MNVLTVLRDTIKWAKKNGIDTSRVPTYVRQDRLKVCKGGAGVEVCENYISLTRQCKICGCFMPVKSWLVFDPLESAKAGEHIKTTCPENKWGPFNQN